MCYFCNGPPIVFRKRQCTLFPLEHQKTLCTMAHEYSCPNPRCNCSFLYASNLQRHFRISPLCNPALGGYPAGNADSFDLSGMDLSFLTTRSDTAGEGRSEVVVNINASSPNTCHQDTEPSCFVHTKFQFGRLTCLQQPTIHGVVSRGSPYSRFVYRGATR